MQPYTQNRALQIAFPERQIASRPSFPSKHVSPSHQNPSHQNPSHLIQTRPTPRYGMAPKPFLVRENMTIPDRSAARPVHRSIKRSAAQIRQREVAARVIAIDLRRPVEASGVSHMRRDQQNTQLMGSFNAFRPVARLGHRIIGWLSPSR